MSRGGDARELLDKLLPQSFPGLPLHQVELIDLADDPDEQGVHLLVNRQGKSFHLWSCNGELSSVEHLDKQDLLKVLRHQTELFQNSRTISTSAGSELRYQRFGPWKSTTIPLLIEEGAHPELVRENGEIRVRCEVPEGRIMLDIRRSELHPPSAELILSRLNSMKFENSPTLLGMSFWDNGSSQLSWMRLTRSRASAGSGFKPFLSDLKSIMDEFHKLPIEKVEGYLVKLSRSRKTPSIEAAASMGSVLGKLHGSIMLEERIRTSGRMGVSSEIIELFNPMEFSTGDVGSILGLSSSYLTELKKEFIKLLGDRQRINPESGRKMKVLKHPRTYIEGIDLFDLGLLREGFLKKERVIRSKFSSLRDFTGSPMVPGGVDPRLDRVDMDMDGNFVIEHFDWKPFGSESGEMSKVLPLKDLALVLNSLNKARYLASRQVLRDLSARSRLDERQMVTLFLEYSMAKSDHNQIMKDFNLFRTVSGRNVPFRHVFSIAVVGALWFQLARNSLVTGYTSQLQEMGRENILAYPEHVDTVLGTDILRSLLGLSGSLKLLRKDKVASTIGLESELMNAICLSDQA